jgi:putative FmdB family regulatory protein
MPIFEYLCQDCGTKFEKLVRRSEDAAALLCPSCGQKHLRQELSVFAAHAASAKQPPAPMCPSGGPCRTPGACGLN